MHWFNLNYLIETTHYASDTSSIDEHVKKNIPALKLNFGKNLIENNKIRPKNI